MNQLSQSILDILQSKYPEMLSIDDIERKVWDTAYYGRAEIYYQLNKLLEIGYVTKVSFENCRNVYYQTVGLE